MSSRTSCPEWRGLLREQLQRQAETLSSLSARAGQNGSNAFQGNGSNGTLTSPPPFHASTRHPAHVPSDDDHGSVASTNYSEAGPRYPEAGPTRGSRPEAGLALGNRPEAGPRPGTAGSAYTSATAVSAGSVGSRASQAEARAVARIKQTGQARVAAKEAVEARGKAGGWRTTRTEPSRLPLDLLSRMLNAPR
ncbi:hypothetical protein T484DRAFT_1895254 [Baffinella frigidus]|nr:hypothetical protein T484DRAFT_1895254 [Cryptophyta sp. CCMP2293]